MKKMSIKTSSGMTMLDLNKVMCFTINEVIQPLLRSNAYEVDIHMDNGTIFSATFTEAEKAIFENKWSGTE